MLSKNINNGMTGEIIPSIIKIIRSGPLTEVMSSIAKIFEWVRKLLSVARPKLWEAVSRWCAEFWAGFRCGVKLWAMLGAFAVLAQAEMAVYRTRAYKEWALKRRAQIVDTHRTTINAGVRRALQSRLVPLTSTVSKSHSHAEAASERNAATEIMLAAVRSAGFVPYVISGSPREVTEQGVRRHYCLADLNQDMKEDPLTDKHVIVMTDVDYYVDMPRLIARGRPIMTYNFHPEEVSGEVNNGYFTIKDDEVEYRVTGGKTVRHPIWDYNQDVVYCPRPIVGFWATLRDWASWLFPWFIKSNGGVVAHIDSARMSKHRRITTIVPFADIATDQRLNVYGTDLTRCTYKVGRGAQKEGLPEYNYNSLVYIAEDGPKISVGREGEIACATMPLGEFEAMQIAYHESDKKHLSDTWRRSKLEGNAPAVLHAFLSLNARPATVVHKPGQLAKHFTCLSEDKRVNPYDEPKEYARAFAAPPLSAEAVYPTQSQANDVEGIAGRVLAPIKDSKARLNIRPEYLKYAKEFVELMVPEPGTGKPWSTAQVDEKQSRPTQQLRSKARLWDVRERFEVKAFQKREAYNTPNHPRNISTVTTTHTLNLSCYTYAFKESVLKKQAWYMPGRTPSQIASALQDYCATEETIHQTDYSRFDGYINRWLRVNIEHACMLRWVHSDHWAELEALLKDELHPKARNRTIVYDPEDSRLSGSPLTTDGNTEIRSFPSYAAARMSGMSTAQAAHAIGLSYGDDGISSGLVPADLLVKVSSDLGLKLTVEATVSRGEPVTFLSRLFVDPWTSPTSVQSPRRALLKLHTTSNSHLDIEDCGRAKVSGYLVTDARTPFIGDWCRTYLRCIDSAQITVDEFVSGVVPKDITTWWAAGEDFAANTWPQQEAENTLGLIAEDLGVTTGELRDHITALRQYSGDVMSIPTLEITKYDAPKVDCVVDGVVHHVGSVPTQIAQQTTDNDKPKNVPGMYRTNDAKSSQEVPSRTRESEFRPFTGGRGAPRNATGAPKDSQFGVAQQRSAVRSSDRVSAARGAPANLQPTAEQLRRAPRRQHHGRTGNSGTRVVPSRPDRAQSTGDPTSSTNQHTNRRRTRPRRGGRQRTDPRPPTTDTRQPSGASSSATADGSPSAGGE
uniref:RNA replicase n=1 Tax=Beihai noda-like virus 13 TaxID=1922466 RepID=A0A1L3KFU5_9VIRU|nr:hypothetical protein [Beihai noda-like virus 13]